MSKRFVWKKGDIELRKGKEPTEEQVRHGEEVIDKVIKRRKNGKTN